MPLTTQRRFFYVVRSRSGRDDCPCPCRQCQPSAQLVNKYGPEMDFPDVISIISALRALAEKGHDEATFNLACFYFGGFGVSQVARRPCVRVY